MKLEDPQPDASVRGILPNAAVTVVSVEWHGWTPENRVPGGSPAMLDNPRKRFETFLNDRCMGKAASKLQFVIS